MKLQTTIPTQALLYIPILMLASHMGPREREREGGSYISVSHGEINFLCKGNCKFPDIKLSLIHGS